ncbi:MAG: hypothetical protein EOL91_11750, partial [Actinobacteria bacterium]|nr:hypothetical protein [Actinomycetota bacterium]
MSARVVTSPVKVERSVGDGAAVTLVVVGLAVTVGEVTVGTDVVGLVVTVGVAAVSGDGDGDG